MTNEQMEFAYLAMRIREHGFVIREMCLLKDNYVTMRLTYDTIDVNYGAFLDTQAILKEIFKREISLLSLAINHSLS